MKIYEFNINLQQCHLHFTIIKYYPKLLEISSPSHSYTYIHAHTNLE